MKYTIEVEVSPDDLQTLRACARLAGEDGDGPAMLAEKAVASFCRDARARGYHPAIREIESK